MTENGINRAIAIVLTALMLLSTIVVVIPESNVAAASETNDIIIPVLDSLGVVTTASVILTEVHTGRTITASYDGSIYAYKAPGSPSGYYRVDVTASGYYGFKDNLGFRFDGLSQYTRASPIELTKFGNMQYTYTVTVKDLSGTPIQGATVKFYDRIAKQEINSVSTPSNGTAKLNIFGGTQLDLVASALGKEMNVTNVGVVNSSATVDMRLNASSVVSGFAYKQSGGIANSVVAYMYNTNPAMPWEKKVLRSVGSFVRFDAYPGNWIVVVDGSDVDPYIASKTITTGEIITMSLHNQNQSVENSIMTLSNWNALEIVTNGVWKADKTYPGLGDFNDIGCLRAQVDLALGNADGTVQPGEWSNFASLLSNHGPNHVTTSDLIHVNDGNQTADIQYISATGVSPIVSDFTGAVTLMTDITYSCDVTYTSQVTLQLTGSVYTSEFIAIYDSASMNRSYTLNLVSNYELISNDTTTGKVNITGYQPVKINPLLSATAGSETVTLVFEKSKTPVVAAQIITKDKTNAYAVKNNTTVFYYIVKNATEVIFSGEGSGDPNGNPLTYHWNLGDGTLINTKNKTVTHNYTAGWVNRTVSLNVTDVTGRYNRTTFNVSVDARLPRVVLKAYNMTMSAQTGSVVTIDQHESLKFNANGTVDDLKNTYDGKGIVYSFKWKFGSDEKTVLASDKANNTVTYKFDTAGDIKVVLNVTDVIGNWKNSTITVKVVDKTAPEVKIVNVLNSTWGTSLIERLPVHFNATTTTDNVDKLANLTFYWSFGDKSTNVSGTGAQYANVTHNFSSYGKYDVKLNVTDSSGNNGTLTKTVYIGAGPRPDVAPITITFDPKQFEEGQKGRITVNISNDGSAAAKNVTIELWYYSGTTAQKRIGNITVIRDPNSTSGAVITTLEIGDTAYGYFDWTPDARGNYTIRAVANSTDQQQTNWVTDTVEVKEAGWKQPTLIIGLVVIVIVIPLLLIARKRIASIGGLRRPKAEKEVKEKKKEKGSEEKE